MPSPPRALPLSEVVGRLGSGLADLVSPAADPLVDDVTLAEPSEGGFGVPGDLLLGIAIGDVDQARAAIERMAERGVAALALRRTLAGDPAVAAAATAREIALVGISDAASWAHVAWLLRELLDRAAADSEGGGETGDDLFALADACSAVLGAPVTIEDTRSRVLAYSELHDVADPIRVSTILGRRAPAATVAALRARGVFRHLVRSDEALFLPAASDGSIGARHIIPVRVGEEWVGSIWAVVDRPIPDARVRRIHELVGVIALHLLRIRAETDLGRRLLGERLRAALSGDAAAAGTALPRPPWRVILLGADPGSEPEAALALWESALRRAAWQRPRLAIVDEDLVAVVTDEVGDATPGSWTWLRRLVRRIASREPWANAVAGPRVTDASGLEPGLAAARELARLHSDGEVSGPILTTDESWPALVVARAVAALRDQASVGGGYADPITGGGPNAAGPALDPVLARTLRAWLDHPGDPRACAEALHVHPNTVRYRLGRIRAELGVDPADPTVRLALALLTRVVE